MKKIAKITPFLLLTTITQGCSWLFPYEDEFACKRPDNLGKCVSPMEAYDEITTGVSKAEYMKPASEKTKSDNSKSKKQLKNQPSHVKNGYDRYLDSNYSEVADLLEQPITPLVKPVVTAEMLVLPYSDSAKVLKGERYINIIVEDPSFILGDYLKKKANSIPSIFSD